MSGLSSLAGVLAGDALADAEPMDWLEEAGSLEEQLLRHARRAPSGDVIWPHPGSFREGQTRPVRLGLHLYKGVTGIALFLAALEHVEPRAGRRECVLSTLAYPRRHLRELTAHPELAREHPLDLGGFIGLGGFIYTFLLVGGWLGEQELIEEAKEAAALITPERIADDDVFDVMSGAAGAALALLALDRVAPEAGRGQPSPLERAIACGERLLAGRVSIDGEPRAWPVQGEAPRCGFAHGAAGIAYCLTRLFERTGDARFLQAAEEGIAFEHLRYHRERGDWPIRRFPEPSFMSSWCNGAPGVALGRLGMLELGGAEHLHQDLRAALQTTEANVNKVGDFLCCGQMGKAEVLLRAYEVLGEQRLLRAAEAIAANVISRSRDQSWLYRWLNPEDPEFALSFFRGAAGVGYTLLRLARSVALPCVLTLEWMDPPCR